MKFRKIAALLMAVVMVFGVTACGGGSSSESESASASEAESSSDGSSAEDSGSGDLDIAYIVKAKTDEFWTSMEKGAEAYAKEVGVNLEFQAPEKETDIEKQVQMVENAVIKGVDGIVLSVADSQALIPSIIKANEADIPVVLVNDTIDEEALEADGGYVETYVGINQYDAAKLAGDYAAENIQDGKICYLEGISGVKAHEDRLSGFADAVDFDVLASQTAKCDRNEAFNVMQNVLSATPDVNVVWAINAEMGQGAIQAIEQGGFEGKIQVFDFDASSDDLAAIEAGTLTGTVAQYPEIQASTAIQCCIDAINGEELEDHTETKAQLITKDNLEDYKAEIAELTE
ncbi:MAG: sugar ABC transporter substrate-binding protein [Ruminococcus sp.]|jgi:ribose transport system substrate-binding protein